ncbi:MAG: hypothetical protein JSR86_21330 [Proteobacteria bacterium]|nr:hypothetical protein [Pseudomonadota bacterium]
MGKVLGGLLIGAGAFALAYGLFNTVIFASSLREIGCGHNPLILRITAVVMAGGVSGVLGGAVLVRGGGTPSTPWVGRIMLITWLATGAVLAASVLALPPCSFPAR